MDWPRELHCCQDRGNPLPLVLPLSWNLHPATGTARAAPQRSSRRENQMDKPRIFLGSSGIQEKLLEALTRGLEDIARVQPWTTAFHAGTSTLERLVELTHEVDFAAFVFARDDWTTSSKPGGHEQGSGQASPR